MSVLGLPRGALVALAGLVGLVIGSFLNVVIHRLPRGASLVRPGSHCPSCGAGVRWFDNVPLLAYLWLRGRCRHCGARISWRYPAIELVTGLLFAAIAWRHVPDPMTPVWCAFAAALLACAAIDFDHQIIPDEISLGGLGVALVLVPLVRAASGEGLGAAFAWSAGGAALGGGIFWLVGFLHARVSTAFGRRFEHWPGPGQLVPTPRSLDYWVWFPGVGFGDVKLLALIGAVLGPIGVLQAILAASLAGLVLGLAFAASLRRFGAPFGFGPALAAGALLVLLAPDLLPR
ncbi:MAG TPA: prepilin peptidase [Myxococcota bacterium]|nr:prepilin peptidase [Myxococcota bacterium]